MTRKLMPVWGLFLALLFAQPRPVDAQMRIGLNAGRTFTTIEGDDAEGPFGGDLGNETGFFAGASLGLPLGGILSITPGLYFVQKRMSFEGGLGTIEGFVELSYIEVPVTIGVAVTGADSPFGVSLFAGPEVAFEVDCDGDDGFGEFESPGLISFWPFLDCIGQGEVEESDRKSTDFGLVFGADVSFGNFFVNGGLDMGLTSLVDSDADQDFKNSAWFLGAGILIGG